MSNLDIIAHFDRSDLAEWIRAARRHRMVWLYGHVDNKRCTYVVYISRALCSTDRRSGVTLCAPIINSIMFM